MATFDQLSPEGRAIVELVLQQGKTYAELSTMLGLPEPRVRELAREALVELAPVSARGVADDWRGQLADYVLGQQSGVEESATKGHLRRSEAARSWTRSLLDSLDGLYVNGSMPAIPDAERRRRTSAQGAAPRDAGRRRLIAAAGAVLALVAVAVLLWPVGLLTGGDDDNTPAPAQASEGGGQAGGGQGARQGAATTPTGAPAGIAIAVQQGGKRQLLVQAANLQPSREREAYEVWLYNSRGDARSLGGQVTDQSGNYQAVGPLPEDLGDYRFIDVSLEPLDRNTGHSGQSALRGRVPKLRDPAPNADAKRSRVLGQSVMTPP